MIKFLRDIKRGAGYLPGYGSHPGNIMMIFSLAMLIIAGLCNEGIGWSEGILAGVTVWAATALPLYLMGCVGRAREWDRTFGRNDSF